MKPYYDEGGITIYHCDCREVLPSLSDIDLVFTSPPYNLGAMPWAPLGHWSPGKGSAGGGSAWGAIDGEAGARYAEHDDAMPWCEYVAWQRDVLAQCWKTLADDGAIFYNHKPRVVGERVWLPIELNPELPLRQIIIWSRPGGHNFMSTAYVATHEWIMVLARTDWRVRVGGVPDVWVCNPETGFKEHPAPFPIGLPTRAVETTGARSVLDPFMGVGASLVAAKAAGARGIGVETSERYCEIAAQRLQQEVLAL